MVFSASCYKSDTAGGNGTVFKTLLSDFPILNTTAPIVIPATAPAPWNKSHPATKSHTDPSCSAFSHAVLSDQSPTSQSNLITNLKTYHLQFRASWYFTRRSHSLL